MISFSYLLLGFFLTCSVSGAQAAGELVKRKWMVDGMKREALLHLPSGHDGQAKPVVFVFHELGGSMRQASWCQPVHEFWPEALVVFMQGILTAGALTTLQGEQQGWQTKPGARNDCDLQFFDVVLQSLDEHYSIDKKRIYATGHANGGSFIYLLWATRREVFAAFGPSATVVDRACGRLEPAPVFLIAGENDEFVQFPWQRLMILVLLRANQCGLGKAVEGNCTLYESRIGAPIMTYIHPGGHSYPTKATALITDFFKTQRRP